MTSIDWALDCSAMEAWHDDINSGCLFNAAMARGVPAKRILFSPRRSTEPQQWLRIKVGRRRYMSRKAVMYFSKGPFGWRVRHINRKAPSITINKHRTRLALEAAGISVPRGRAFACDQADAAFDYFRDLGCEACIKPNGSFAGDGVVPRIVDPVHFQSAFRHAARDQEQILVEENVVGEVVRYMVIGTRVVATRLDRPASVVGDGVSTIAELVAAKNAEVRLGNVLSWGAIVIDDEAGRILALDGLSPGSRLPPGERAFLKATSNIPSGGDGIGNPPGLHPSYAEATLRAVAAIPDLVLTAVDVMIADYREPATATNHWFLDLNSAPGIANFHFPREGEPSDVAGHIMDWLLAGGPQ